METNQNHNPESGHRNVFRKLLSYLGGIANSEPQPLYTRRPHFRIPSAEGTFAFSMGTPRTPEGDIVALARPKPGPSEQEENPSQ
ncbi:MAG TPA: hypothetical protein VL989_01115 [Candidatus Sulfotelmatobacter sp.]|nr:hypothetical protein [Candidatus Sulfotelmatobacter sp.]